MKGASISDTASQKELKEIEAFNFDNIPQKIIMVKPVNTEVMEGSLMVQHSEAGLGIKKYIIEKAKNHWKELKEINTNHVLGVAVKKQEVLDNKFMEHVTQNLKWQQGE